MKNNKIHKLKINHRIFQQDIKSRTNMKNLLFLWLCLILKNHQTFHYNYRTFHYSYHVFFVFSFDMR